MVHDTKLELKVDCISRRKSIMPHMGISRSVTMLEPQKGIDRAMSHQSHRGRPMGLVGRTSKSAHHRSYMLNAMSRHSDNEVKG